jgi:hypothetical protein
MKKEKNTRLVYIDKSNIDIYDSLPPNEFKELFMAYFTYKVGDEITADRFSNPLVFSLFKTYQPKIDYNENKWDKRSETSVNNGKKGGRPKNG